MQFKLPTSLGMFLLTSDPSCVDTWVENKGPIDGDVGEMLKQFMRFRLLVGEISEIVKAHEKDSQTPGFENVKKALDQFEKRESEIYDKKTSE